MPRSLARSLPGSPTNSAVLITALVVSASPPASGQSIGDAPGRKLITLADLSTVKAVSGLKLSPDGGHIAFQQSGAVWVLSTQARGAPRKLADGFGPTWSPSGSELAFYARPEGRPDVQIFRVDLETGQKYQLTELGGGVGPDGISWSSRNELVFSAQVPVDPARAPLSSTVPEPASAELGTPLILREDSPDGYALAGILTGVGEPSSRQRETVSELFVHDLTTGNTRQLTRDGAGYRNPAWSPDGTMIVCASQEGFRGGAFVSAVYLLDGITGSRTRLAPGVPEKLNPVWSPDGRSIAYWYLSRTDGEDKGVAVLTVREGQESTEARHVFSGPANDVAWSADGQSLLVTYIDGVTRPVMRVDLKTRAITPVGSTRYAAVRGSLTVSRSGAVAWAESRPDAPVVIRWLRPGAGDAEEIFDPNPEVRTWALGQQEVVRWQNDHGDERQGVLILPAGYEPGRRYPLIVSAYSQEGHLNAFNGEPSPGFANQAYASRGYVVFFPGPRVAWMRGGAAGPDAVGGPGGWDLTVDDVESGVDILIERGIVDPNRMAIMGFSNGGAASAAVIARTNRYEAAIVIAPANLNWVDQALFEDNRAARWIATKTFVGIHKEVWEVPMTYVQGSPVFEMHHVETPLLLAVGDQDDPSFTLPTIQAYLALRSEGKNVTLLRYPDQGHGFFGPAADDLNKRITAFLDSRLAPRRPLERDRN